MSRRLAADWAICTGVLMLVYSCRGWLLASLLQGRYPWTALVVDVLALALLIAVFRTLDLGLRVAFERVLRRLEGDEPARRRTRYRRLAGVLRFCIIFALAAPFLVTLAQIHPQRIACAQRPDAWGLPYEDVTLTSEGLRLAAWHIPGNAGNDRPVVLIAHGIGANKQNFLMVAAQIQRWGYHVFMMDFRAHGDSAGLVSTLGLKEAADVKAAYDWIAERHPGQPIYGLGYSMGGAALARACAGHGLCERIILDCTFARLENSFRHTMGGYHIPGPLVSAGWHACRFWGWAFTGVDPREIQTEQCFHRLGDRPLLLIHGTKDGTSSCTDSLCLAEQVNGKAEVWLVEGAGHLQALAHPDYCNRLRRFFDRAIP